MAFKYLNGNIKRRPRQLNKGSRHRAGQGVGMLLCIILCTGATASLRAQSPQQDMAKFRAVFQKIQDLPVYQYETVTDASFPNGQKDRLTARLCVDRKNKRLYYKTNSELLIIGQQWIYSADLFNKRINIFNKNQYPKYKDRLPDFNGFFKGGLIKNLMDSVIFRYASACKADRSGDLLTFRLNFPKGFYVEDFVLVYDTKTELPRTIRFRLKYAGGGPAGGPSQSAVYETVCKNYSKQIPEQFFDTGNYFYVRDGKVKLLKFINYKVSSVL